MTEALLLDMPEEREGDEPWFIEAKDRDPTPEFNRQILFLGRLKTLAPAVTAIAIPNAGKGSDWERIRRWREGACAGALDLLITWAPTRPGDRGVFFAEFKNGEKPPTRVQRDRLNEHYRQGHGCGVYRNADTLLNHLRAAGAPFIDGARPIGEIIRPIVAEITRRSGR
jgi:hypothetical protein